MMRGLFHTGRRMACALYRFQEKDFGNLSNFLFSEKMLDIRIKSL
jgi:hypothetical protein